MDRAERGGGTRSCGVASMPGSPLRGGFPQIPPVFSDPLFIPNMAKVVYKVVKPPVVLKALPSTGSHEVPSASNQPEDSGPELEVSEPKESAPSTSQPCQQVQERISEASNTDSDKADANSLKPGISPLAMQDTFALFAGSLVPSCQKLALVLGNDCERFCASRPLLGSYVHQESI